jgi:hypothetical protein
MMLADGRKQTNGHDAANKRFSGHVTKSDRHVTKDEIKRKVTWEKRENSRILGCGAT